MDEYTCRKGVCQGAELLLALAKRFPSLLRFLVEVCVLHGHRGMSGKGLQEVEVALPVRLMGIPRSEGKNTFERSFVDKGDHQVHPDLLHVGCETDLVLFLSDPRRIIPHDRLARSFDESGDLLGKGRLLAAVNEGPVSLKTVVAAGWM